jgi:Protein of unknown function (DUF1549)
MPPWGVRTGMNVNPRLLLLLFLVPLSLVESMPAQPASVRLDAALMRDFQEAQTRHGIAANLKLPGLADDGAFLRRACIDLAGRLPQAEEARLFFADLSATKRAKLVDALLKETGAAEVRYRMLAEIFRVQNDAQMISVLREAAREDWPYDLIAAKMIDEGHLRRRDDGNALRTAVEASQALLGVDLYCAMCHNHPFNDNTQKQAYELAACFAGKGLLRLPRDYRYRDGNPGDVVSPKLLSLSPGIPQRQIARTSDKQHALTQWLTGAENPRFTQVAALRVWSALFGSPQTEVVRTRGGVDAAESWQAIFQTNNHWGGQSCFEPSHRDRSRLRFFDTEDLPLAVLELAAEFRRSGLRIGEMMRLLACTEAYSRAACDGGAMPMGSYLLPAPQIRRLPSEVLWTTVSGETTVQWPEAPPEGHPLRLLGRGTREWSDESVTPVSHALARWLMNGPQPKVTALDAETLFLEMLGRLPTAGERRAIDHEKATLEDVAWALMNSTEFLFRS